MKKLLTDKITKIDKNMNQIDNIITEEELLQMAKRGEKDYKRGKTKILHSLNDL